jgi:precorrin-8X/cobalt-precorrin-8 methylmutase
MNEPASRPDGSLVSRYALRPEAIEARSLALVDEALGDRFAAPDERYVAVRILYAAGDLHLAEALRFAPNAVSAGVKALRSHAPIVADVRMVVAGINQRLTDALGVERLCAIDDASVAVRARDQHLPRAVEAIRSLHERLDGAVAVIGNAPTALLALLDLVDAGVRPALIIGMPVGFVGATEAKDELVRRTVPYLTIAGPRGGSPLAAAAINALLLLATPEPERQDRARTAVLFAGHGSRASDAAEAMLAAVDNVRSRGTYPIVETGYLEMTEPDIPEALRRCVEQGATRVLVVPYFLHQGMHIRRDIPAVLRKEADRYPGLSVSMGRPIGLHADLANVMVAGALETERLVDIRETPAFVAPARGQATPDDGG